MSKKRMVLVGIVVGTLVGLFGTASKARAADVLNLNSVTQATGPQVEGSGTYSTAATLVYIHLVVVDPNGVTVSTTNATEINLDWSSISNATGSLTVGVTYAVHAEMRTKTNGINNDTITAAMQIKIK